MPFVDDINLTNYKDEPQQSAGFIDDLGIASQGNRPYGIGEMRKRPSGAGRSFAPSFTDKAVEFMTAGHIPAKPFGVQEELTPEGTLSKQFPQEGGKTGFFEDPTTFAAMGVAQGARTGVQAAKPLVGKIAKGIGAGIREGVGWMTGGASEIPALGKAGVKGLAKNVEVKNLEKVAAKRAGKEFAEVPVEVGTKEGSLVEQVLKTTGEGISKEKQVSDLMPEKPVKVEESTQPWEMTRKEFITKATDLTNREDFASAWTPIKSPRGAMNTIEFTPYKGGEGFDGVMRWNDSEGIGRGILTIDNGKVWEVAVQKEWRNKGIASQLYKEAAKRGVTESKGTITPAAMGVRHKMVVEQALSEGKPVPPEVLKGYPDLVKKGESVVKAEKASPFQETPNLSIDRVEAKKRPDGVWQLFYRGTRNEVFPNEKFTSASEARNFFKAEKVKIETKPLSPELEPLAQKTSRYSSEITDLREQVNVGEAGKRTLNQLGEPVITQSTYPSWMQNRGWTKKEVLGAIDKGLEGKPLGIKQQEIFDTVKTEARNQFSQKIRIEQNNRIQPIKTGELEVGDKIRVKGDTLKVTEKTDEKIVIKDGQTYELDPYFDTIEGKNLSPQAKGKDTGLTKLAEEQKATEQAGRIIIDLGKKDTKSAYTFPKENEFPYQSAKGIKPEGIVTKLKNVATEVGHKFSRTFEHLANNAENAPVINIFKRLEKQKEVVADRTTRSIGETLSGLDKEAYNLFNRKVILDDLMSDVNRGLYTNDKKLPFNFTPEGLMQEKGKLDALISTNPKVTEALEKRKDILDVVKSEYVAALKPYKPGVEDMFKENYYRHQVLDYVTENGIFGTGKKLKTPQKGYMKARGGASNLYNTDFIEAEHNIMAQMLHDAETAKALTDIKIAEKVDDVIKEIKNIAKEKGLDDWHKAIPDGYKVWQPKEGSVFYPTLTVSENTAAKIMEGELESLVEGGGKIFNEALAVGGKRQEWVVRNEVADTLNNLVRERSKGIISETDLGVLRAWKRWQLVSPRRYFKYNTRNMTGDAEAVFLGNVSGFKKAPKATKELYDVFYGKKQMSEDMSAWFERGGVGSTLQAQEMDGLKKTWMFTRLHEKPDLNIWKKYWNTVRVSTDFRESVLRYANFLDYKEQIIKNGGKPLNYGASKPEMIDALKDIDDKAFWLSNDLLGAYDKVSVAGQVLRERAIPFWSWQEVNFKRYIQLFKNTSNNSDFAAKLGFKLGATGVRGAIKVGTFAIKATAFASALAVYNHTFFPDEEKELPPDLRSTPHVILGRDSKGDIQYFSRMGTLDDFISWFGLDATPRLINDYLSGKKTLKELIQTQVKETKKAPLNKLVQGGEPFIKLGSELISRRSVFPDVTKPGTIRDRGLHVARSFGLENEYIAMTGKPSKGYGKSLKGLFIYTMDTGESAYRQSYDLKNNFMKKQGRTSEGFWLTPTGDALYNMKLAVKYGDKKSIDKYMNQYLGIALKQGKTPQQIKQGIITSLKTMNPLYGMNEQTQKAFVASLDKEDQDTLVKAIDFYNDVLSGNKKEAELMQQ